MLYSTVNGSFVLCNLSNSKYNRLYVKRLFEQLEFYLRNQVAFENRTCNGSAVLLFE